MAAAASRGKSNSPFRDMRLAVLVILEFGKDENYYYFFFFFSKIIMIIIIRLVGNDAVVGNERIGRVPKTAIGTREYLGGTLAASSYVKETWHRLFVTGNNASGYLQITE